VFTETLIAGLFAFAIFSNLWDFLVLDISEWRKTIFMGSVGLLAFVLLFGKISFVNLFKIIKDQLGA
jgi:hypothetical protein